MAKNHSLGVKSVKIAWSKNWARTKTRLFLRCTGQNLFRTVEKSWKSRTVWSQWSGKKYFFLDKVWSFSPSCRNWPICAYIHICSAYYAPQMHFRIRMHISTIIYRDPEVNWKWLPFYLYNMRECLSSLFVEAGLWAFSLTQRVFINEFDKCFLVQKLESFERQLLICMKGKLYLTSINWIFSHQNELCVLTWQTIYRNVCTLLQESSH